MVCRTEIKSLRMKNFLCFPDRAITFKPGLNILEGPAESGKSTIIDAIKTVLYESAEIENRFTVNSMMKEKSPVLEIVFAVGEKQFTLIRNYETKSDRMVDDAGITFRGEEISEKITTYFGSDSQSTFVLLNTVSADSLSVLETQVGALKTALEIPVFSGFDRQNADAFIGGKILELEKSSVKGKSELEVISDQISSRLQEKNALDERMSQLEKRKNELDEILTQIKQFQSEIAHLDEQITGGNAYLCINERMISIEERLQSQLGNYSRAEQVMDDLDRVEKEYESLNIPEPLELAEITSERSDTLEKVDFAKQEMDELQVKRKNTGRGFTASSLVLLILCLTYILTNNDIFSIGQYAVYILYAIPIMAVIWLVRLGSYIIRTVGKRAASSKFREQVTKLDEFYAEVNLKYSLKSADPIATIVECIQRKQFLGMSAENLRATIGHLSEDKGMEFLIQQKEQIETEVAQLNQELAPLVQYAAISGQVLQLNEEFTAKKVRGNALGGRAKQLASECTAMDKLVESIATVEGEVDTLKLQHKELSEQIELYKVTRMALNRAADSLVEDTLLLFGKSAGEFLLQMTNGRYDEVRLATEPKQFAVKLSDAENWIDIHQLSSTTRDAVYISLRLAALSLLSMDYASPFICDQPESRFDSERLNKFYEVLINQSKNRQVLFVANREHTLRSNVHMIACDRLVEESVTV
ncbi:MAG: AAA family ATPase [candidate division Zixibacteria bacterium]|nr:AAA family ATPase [candidate division Zixibacteria bacterium]